MSEGGVKMTEDQMALAKASFEKHDKRNQQKIGVKEIPQAMKVLGHNLKAEWLDKVQDEIDSEGTGYIDFDEFLNLVKKKMQSDEDERELKDIFRVLDKDKKGEIDVQDLRWILKSLGDDLTEEEIEDMITDTDTDGSGFVDYDEFAHLMLSS